MDLKEFIANFAEQFDDTDASEIQADTEFHELDEWGKSYRHGCDCHGEDYLWKSHYGQGNP